MHLDLAGLDHAGLRRTSKEAKLASLIAKGMETEKKKTKTGEFAGKIIGEDQGFGKQREGKDSSPY